MNKGKKLTAVVAAAATTAAMVAPAFADTTASFTDIDGSYAKTAITDLVAKGIIHGVDATHFNPTGNITRQDFAVILAGALGLDVSKAPATATFSDVPTTNYAYKYVEALHAKGIISGVSATEFGYGANITREDMAVMFVRALGVDVTGQGSSLTFADNDQIASYAKDAVGYAVAKGLLHGMDATHFAPTAPAQRQQVALVAESFLGMQAPALTGATFVDNSTITLNFSGAISSIAASDVAVAVKASNAAVSVSSVTLSADGKSATVKVAAPLTAGTTYSVTYKGVEKDVTTAAQLAVSSVAALNAEEIAVTFNNTVEATTAATKANYTVTLNNSSNALDPTTAAYTTTLQSDNKTVIIRLATAMKNGESYSVSVANVLDSAYNAMVAYSDTNKLFNDTTAPVVKSASVSSTALTLNFNKPVAAGATVKIDGLTIATGSPATPVPLVADSTTVGGDYTYTVALGGQTAANVANFNADGQHTVTVYNITDTDSPANTTAVQSVNYTVSANTNAPSVVSVTPGDQTSFLVKFSEPLASLGSTNFTIKSGTYTFASADYTVTQDLTDDGTGDTYKVAFVPGVLTDANNPLYPAGQSSVALNVAVSGFEDGSNLYGAPYTGTVTLSKPANGPAVVAAGLNSVDKTNGIIKVKFNENVQAPVAADITVSKDGVVLPVANATLDTDTSIVDITLDNTKVTLPLSSGSYTVSFAAGAVTDTYGVASQAQSTTANYNVGTTYFTPAAGPINAAADDSFIVDFGSTHPMTSSATNVANYKLDGVALPAGSTAAFYGDQTKVKITLPAGYFPTNTSDLLTISTNVVDQNGQVVGASSNDGTNFTEMVNFTDDVAPVLKSAQYDVASTTDTTTSELLLTFSETVKQGTTDNAGSPLHGDDFTVTVNGAAVSYTETVVGDNTIVLTLANKITMNQPVKVTVNPVGSSNAAMNTTDLAGNALTSGTTVTVSGTTNLNHQ